MGLWLAGVLFAGAVPGAWSAEFRLDHLAAGLTNRIGLTPPQRLQLSRTQPTEVRKAPADLVAPRYAILRLGPRETATRIVLILDEPEGKPARLFADANANGDLTDDESPTWTPQAVAGKDGKEYTQYNGDATVSVGYGGARLNLHVALLRFDPKDPSRAPLKDNLLYFPDFGREGTVRLEDKRYSMLLADRSGQGDYRGGDVVMYVDISGDGKYDSRVEAFPGNRPFNIAGINYDVTAMTAAGNSFIVERSKVNYGGRKAIPFKAVTTDGKTINFPSTYKGRIVLLDFWATWCGPCVGEIPNLTAAYQKYRLQGFEILGISLDQAGEGANLAAFTRARRMPWMQVYEGKYWDASVAQLYSVNSIPATFLVDGDTGTILAEGSALRGTKLDATLGSALLAKRPLK